MYRTIKIRLHATKEQKEHLLAYEEVYHTDFTGFDSSAAQAPIQH